MYTYKIKLKYLYNIFFYFKPKLSKRAVNPIKIKALYKCVV